MSYRRMLPPAGESGNRAGLLAKAHRRLTTAVENGVACGGLEPISVIAPLQTPLQLPVVTVPRADEEVEVSVPILPRGDSHLL